MLGFLFHPLRSAIENRAFDWIRLAVRDCHRGDRGARGPCSARRELGGRVHEVSGSDADYERPPICPACGVTMGIVVDGEEEDATRYVCLECGFSDEGSASGLTAR